MTPREEIDITVRKMMDDLNSRPVERHVIPAPQPPIMISVSLKEWSDLHRRNGYLEGVMAAVVSSDTECWLKDAWEYYQHVMLGMPVVVEKEP